MFAHYLICHRFTRTEKSLWIASLLFWRWSVVLLKVSPYYCCHHNHCFHSHCHDSHDNDQQGDPVWKESVPQSLKQKIIQVDSRGTLESRPITIKTEIKVTTIKTLRRSTSTKTAWLTTRSSSPSSRSRCRFISLRLSKFMWNAISGKAFRAGIKEEKSLQAIVKGYYSLLFCRPPKTISYSISLNKFPIQMYPHKSRWISFKLEGTIISCVELPFVKHFPP